MATGKIDQDYGQVHGNVKGVKQSLVKEMEKLYDADMEMLRHEFVSQDVMDKLAYFTDRINKEISIYIARDGMVMDVSIGTHDRVGLPDLRVRRGKRRLSGIRCIHTHPRGSGVLSSVDISTLKRMRFDAMAAIGVINGKPYDMQAAILSELYENGEYAHTLHGPWRVDAINHDHLFQEILHCADVISKSASLLESLEKPGDRAILVGLDLDGDGERSLAELERLADTAGAQILHTELQNRDRIDTATYIGSGKVSQLALLRQSMDATLFIFDDELTGAQIRNLEKEIGCRVIDRTTLILDIFAGRATTHEGKLQVELAQYKYRLPRLVGAGEAMSRLAGGIGTRGPGESKLESDRRRVRQRIHELETEVEKLKKRRSINRNRRDKNNVPVLALVGYTNAGKSTLLNALTKSEVFAEDKLFATLDPVTRRLELPGGREVLLTDTVGFISKLPHDLVDAFRSTLEEAVFADVLLHVVDASSSDMELQYKVAETVLKELGAGEKSKIVVMNKIDKVPEIPQLCSEDKVIGVSALNHAGFEELLESVEEALNEGLIYAELLIPYDKSELANMLFETSEVISQEYGEQGIEIKAHMSREMHQRMLGKLK